MDTRYAKPLSSRVRSEITHTFADDDNNDVDVDAEVVHASPLLKPVRVRVPVPAFASASAHTVAMTTLKRVESRSKKTTSKKYTTSASSSGQPVVHIDANAIHGGPGTITLRTLMGEDNKPTFDELVQLWPRSRENLLLVVRKHLQRVIAFRGSELQLENIVRVSAAVNDSTAQHSAVYVGCVAGSSEGACAQFTFEIDTELYRMPVHIAVKMFNDDDYAVDATYSPFDYKNPQPVFIADKNRTRELLLGRMLNILVQANVTPHFPCIYETVEIESKRGVVSEMAHMTLRQFLATELIKIPADHDRRTILHIMFVQVLQGLVAAETHYGMHHYDLNTNNVMMTFVANASYCYKLNGMTYVVPNFGMCWKIIDYTLSTSAVLFSPNDHYNVVLGVREIVNAPVRRLARNSNMYKTHAYSLLDILNLISDVRLQLSMEMAAGHELCNELEMICAIASESTPGAESTLLRNRNYITLDPSKQTEAHFDAIAEMSQETGVLQSVFAMAAKPFEPLPRKKLHCHVVFDTAKRVFFPGQQLGAFERKFFNITPGGKLERRK